MTTSPVTFSPDGHRAVFTGGPGWPGGGTPPPRPRTRAPRTPSGRGRPPTSPAARRPGRGRRPGPAGPEWCLAALLTDGFVLLRGVPRRPARSSKSPRARLRPRDQLRTTLRCAGRAESGQPGLHRPADRPHTDNPYRDPVPTVQLLHCLANAAEGGDSGLVDGFAAAGLLRGANPAAFAMLTRTPVTFRYADASAELRATRPMIGLRPGGRIRQDPLQQPLAATVAGRASARSLAGTAARSTRPIGPSPEILLGRNSLGSGSIPATA